MQIGAIFPTTEIGSDPVAIRDWCQAAESLGFGHVVAYDHVLGAVHEDREPPLPGPYTERDAFHEPLTLFAWMAGVTRSLELATGVLAIDGGLREDHQMFWRAREGEGTPRSNRGELEERQPGTRGLPGSRGHQGPQSTVEPELGFHDGHPELSSSDGLLDHPAIAGCGDAARRRARGGARGCVRRGGGCLDMSWRRLVVCATCVGITARGWSAAADDEHPR